MNSVLSEIIPDSILKKGYLSYIFAFISIVILSIHVQYIPPFMCTWLLCWGLEHYFYCGVKWNLSTSHKTLFLLFLSYYIWQVTGLIYTSDIKLGLLNLFSRLSLILFPIVLLYPGEIIKYKVRTLIRIFAISCSIFIFICFVYALFRTVNLQNGVWTFNSHPGEFSWLSYFYGPDLTISQHPSYIAMYALLSAFICLESWFDQHLKFKLRIWWLVIGVLLLISQYFISSRTGIFGTLILVPIYFIIKLRKIGKKNFAWVWIILIILALTPIILKNQRVDYLYGQVFNKQVGFERKEDPRFLIWKSALNVVNKNLLIGVGIGDVRTELAHEYERIGEENMAKERFNAHNQFLEVLLENGIIGLILFVSMLGCMIYISISDKNLIYGFFIMIMVLFFMFETVLYRLAGVTFFSLFSFLLILPEKNKNQEYGDNYKKKE